MSAIGTPDWQRGVVSAQVLLAAVPARATSVTVGVPPNAETIIVSTTIANPFGVWTCTGVTTGIQYAGARVANNGAVGQDATYFFDVSQAVDTEVTIATTQLLPPKWYVYADAAAHLVVDAGKLTSAVGVPYSIPTAPDTNTSSHPPAELIFAGGALTSGTTIVASPGVNNRLRLFALHLAVATVGAVWTVQDLGGSQHFIWCVGNGNVSLEIPLTGYAMAANDGLELYNWTGGGSGYVTVLYTNEEI